tara:strand:+ start:2119 stop:2496 length:378 start_codon:yes stop_codon:yes gene_type:complete
MATKTLDAELRLSTAGTVLGLFGLNTNVVDALSFDDTSVASATITTSTSPTEIYAVGITDIRYVYIQSLSGNADNVLVGEASGTKYYAILKPGEFMFLPVNAAMGIEVKAVTNAPIVEYAWFKQV